MDIGKRIKEIRNSKKITQAELAKKAGVSQAFISSIENGTKNISIKVLTKICKKGLEISLSNFFANNNNPVNNKVSICELINKLREELHCLMNKKGVIDEIVIKKSKELDEVLMKYQKKYL